jgi:hypothetical protein
MGRSLTTQLNPHNVASQSIAVIARGDGIDSSLIPERPEDGLFVEAAIHCAVVSLSGPPRWFRTGTFHSCRGLVCHEMYPLQ